MIGFVDPVLVQQHRAEALSFTELAWIVVGALLFLAVLVVAREVRDFNRSAAERDAERDRERTQRRTELVHVGVTDGVDTWAWPGNRTDADHNSTARRPAA